MHTSPETISDNDYLISSANSSGQLTKVKRMAKGRMAAGGRAGAGTRAKHPYASPTSITKCVYCVKGIHY